MKDDDSNVVDMEPHRNVRFMSKQDSKRHGLLLKVCGLFIRSIVSIGFKEGISMRIQQGGRLWDITVKSQESGPDFPAG